MICVTLVIYLQVLFVLVKTNAITFLRLSDWSTIMTQLTLLDGFQGTDATFLQKLQSNHKKNDLYISPKNTADKTFGIKHFAGTVFYRSTGEAFISNWDPCGLFLYTRTNDLMKP